MRLFPYVLTRMGGGSFDQLTRVDYTQLVERVERLYALQTEKQQRKQQLCDHLLEGIRGLTDPKAQNQVQNVRRDIFNERPVKPSALIQVRQHLPDILIAGLDEYLTFEARIKAESEQAEELYRRLVYEGRQQLQRLAQDEYLQKGLLLSSQSLLSALVDYTAKNPDEFRKKEFQTEQSLLKYLTRMYTKTSPFSTFNNLALGTLCASPDKAVQIDANPGPASAVVGHIRLNNNLFRYLKDLFTASRNVHWHLLLRPNPTVEHQGDHYRYLTNHNNIEAFQRIPANPVVALLLELTRANKAGIRFSTLLLETCEYVDAPEDAIEQYLEQLIGYGFLEYDLGVSGTDPDWDLKLVKELQYLAQQEVAHADELITTLRHVRTLAGLYGFAPVQERQQILNEAFHSFRATCMKLHEAAGLPERERQTLQELEAEWREKKQEAERKKKEIGQQEEQKVLVAEKETNGGSETDEAAFEHKSSTYFHFKPEQLFYEDTTREVCVRLDEDKLEEFVQTLYGLLAELRPFRGLTNEREQMRQYLTQKYSPEARVNLLTFYEDFYRDVKKPEAERQARQRKEAAEKAKNTHQKEPLPVEAQVADRDPAQNKAPLAHTDFNAARQEKVRRWMEHCVAALRGGANGSADQVNVPPNLLQQVNEALPELAKPQTLPGSYGAFVQLYQEHDEHGTCQLKGVLNATVTGHGKMLSRFLHIFPDEVTQSVRDWNNALQDEKSLFIENADASYFNANLHPPLLPYEVRMPGSHNSLPPERQLPITDFEVLLDAASGEIKLLHKPTAKRACVFDLGFQGHGGRSQLFQLLDKFTGAEYLFVHPLVSAVNAASETKTESPAAHTAGGSPGPGQIVVHPRIVYENKLVLQRKGWFVPREIIPQRYPGMSDWGYYAALNQWRKAQGIADEVFVTISPDRHQADADPERMKKLGRDDYKPQYIHFNDPLLVHLFEKLMVKVPFTLKIEEMLPNSRQLLPINGQRFVTEFVMQWYLREGSNQ